MFTDQPYPAMDDLAGWIGDVANHFKLQSFFALGFVDHPLQLFAPLGCKATDDDGDSPAMNSPNAPLLARTIPSQRWRGRIHFHPLHHVQKH